MRNKYLYLVLPAVFLALLFFVFLSKASEKNDTLNSNNTQNSNTTIQQENQSNTEKINQADNNTQILVVDPERCRGCGRCTRIDPEHFKMVGAVAKTISQSNLDTKLLREAIDSCPASAISIS